ncbi:MAG: hypothetical protein JW746_04260 [Candidatus Krumholzibacteriota bacterium]|nr:hypothetical protein [Candidatus Krumholzibacteriota bacterium]
MSGCRFFPVAAVFLVSVIALTGCEQGTGPVEGEPAGISDSQISFGKIDTVSIFSGNGICGGPDTLVLARSPSDPMFIEALIGGGNDSDGCSCFNAGDPESPSLPITTYYPTDKSGDFLTYFELPEDFSNVHLIFSVIADDAAQIYLNGIFIDQVDLYDISSPGEKKAWTFDICGDDLFVYPVNTLLFKVRNTGTGYYGDPAARADSADCMYLEFWGMYTSQTEDTCGVLIDIKPGSDINPVNCMKLNGVIPVAILTTDCFDACEVDHTTVRFGPDGASENHFNKHGMIRHEKDVDFDGDIDLVFHFLASETGIECGDCGATLSGFTFSGDYFEVCDRIVTVPDKEGGSD